jgi:folate-dependent phosphoribosylglycinamide formyltransferase PurN
MFAIKSYTKKSLAMLVPDKSIKGSVVVEKLSTDTFFSEWSIFLISENSFFEKNLIRANWVHMSYSEFLAEINRGTEFDYVISAGWGKIIPPEIIKSANKAALNCHSSYLPDYKGTSVYRYYWAHAESYSGATVHYLTENLDKGDIVAQTKFKIYLFDTPKSILVRASEFTAILIVEAIFKVESGFNGLEQKEGRYFSKTVTRRGLYIRRVYNVVARKIGLPVWWCASRRIK